MRHIQEFLLGQNNLIDLRNELSSNDHQQLYQHLTRCPVALQMFLDYNPEYWPFIPMRMKYAEEQNLSYMKSKRKVRKTNSIQMLLDNIPLPPFDYQFSKQQKNEQIQFFQYEHHQHLPNVRCDLCNATIIGIKLHFRLYFSSTRKCFNDISPIYSSTLCHTW